MTDELVLARRYQSAHSTLMDRVAGVLALLWLRQPALTDEQLADFTQHAVPLVSAAQTQAIGLSVSYVTATTAVPATIDAGAIQAGLRDGTPLADVYARPTVTLRALLGEGRPYADAVNAVAARIDATSRTDVQLASRAGARAAMIATGVVGYRRVCGGTPCLLCLSASSQRYHARDLMPIHPRCSCTVAPIIGTKDPGHIIDQALLEQLKSNDYLAHLRTGTSTPSLALRGQYVVHEHGEFGPVLAVPGQHFDAAAAVAA